MEKGIKNQTSQTIEEAKDVSYEFPESEKITINKYALQIQLSKYKEAILNSFDWNDVFKLIVVILSLWIPVITGSFKDVWIFSSEEIFGAVLTLAILLTFIFLWRNIIRPIYCSYLKTKEISTDPEKMANYILDQCNQKNK